MDILKAFCQLPGLIDNNPGIISPFGELSPISLTYAKEKGYYSDGANYPEANLVSFLSTDDLNVQKELDAQILPHLLAACKYVYDVHVADNILDLSAFTSAFTAAATSIAAPTGFFVADFTVTNVAINALVAHPDTINFPNRNMPDFITWEILHVPSGDDYTVTIWFVDQSFQTQYDEYELVVIPPVANPVNFINLKTSSTTQAINTINSMTGNLLVDAIDDAIAGNPPTIQRTINVPWVNPSTLASVNAYWAILIYGAQGNNPEAIEEAILNWIDDQGPPVSPSADWQSYFPSLFAASEFYLIPYWDKVAIPENLSLNGIYQPHIPLSQIGNVAQVFSIGYAGSDVLTACTIATSIFKSLTYLAVGSINNEGGEIRIDQKFPDITSLVSSSIDFNRMDPDTQAFIVFLQSLFAEAEEATPSTIVDPAFSKVTRGGFLYISGRHSNTDYVMLTKHSFLNDSNGSLSTP